MRRGPASRFIAAAGLAAIALTLMAPSLSRAGTLKPSEALDGYLASRRDEQPACSDSLFAVQIDASLPALNKHGSMAGFKRMVQPGQAVYRGLRFTGDKLVKTQVIARFLARDTDPPPRGSDLAVAPANYIFTYGGVSPYLGRAAYVYLLKPRHKRAGLFRGELWLDAETGAPVRLWGDLVKSPSLFVRSFRFVQDYQTVHGCAEPLRVLLTAQTRIVGTVEMTMWLRPVSEEREAAAVGDAISNWEPGGQSGQ